MADTCMSCVIHSRCALCLHVLDTCDITAVTLSLFAALPARPGSQKTQSATPQPQAKALYDFPGDADGDLPFSAGDTILLLEKIDSEWLRGKVRGTEGIFPAAYVEIIHQLS